MPIRACPSSSGAHPLLPHGDHLQSKYYVPVDGLAYCGLFHRDAARYGLRKAYRSFRTKTHPFKIFLASITWGRIYGRSVVGQASVNDDLYLLLPGITSTFYGNMVSIMLSRHADQIILKSGLPFYALDAKQNELIDEKSARIFDKVLAKDPRSKIEYIDGGLTLSSTGLTISVDGSSRRLWRGNRRCMLDRRSTSL